jgi:hypothetical protein
LLDARFAVGRCLEAQQQWKKARQNYEDLIAASSNSQWAERARNRIVAMDREARARGETLAPPQAKQGGAPAVIPQVLLPATPATPVTPAAKPPAPAPTKK